MVLGMPVQGKPSDGVGTIYRSEHTPLLQTHADGLFAAGFHYGGGCAQTGSVELVVAHSVPIRLDVFLALSGLLDGEVGREGCEHRIKLSSLQFAAAFVRPLFRQVGSRSVDRFENCGKVLVCVEPIDDLDCVGEQLDCDVPYPRRPVAEYGAPLPDQRVW